MFSYSGIHFARWKLEASFFVSLVRLLLCGCTLSLYALYIPFSEESPFSYQISLSQHGEHVWTVFQAINPIENF